MCEQEKAFRSLTSSGLELALTEIDIRLPLPKDEEKLADQSRDYTDVIEACLAIKKCVGFSTWGVTDKYSWVPDVFAGEGDALLWDDEFEKKPAYFGVSKSLDKKKRW